MNIVHQLETTIQKCRGIALIQLVLLLLLLSQAELKLPNKLKCEYHSLYSLVNCFFSLSNENILINNNKNDNVQVFFPIFVVNYFLFFLFCIDANLSLEIDVEKCLLFFVLNEEPLLMLQIWRMDSKRISACFV